jgi:Uma2 family endonuclease
MGSTETGALALWYNPTIMAIAPDRLKHVPNRLLGALHRAGMSEAALRETYGLDPESLSRALVQPAERLSIADLDYLPEDGYRYELWEGELVRMSPSKRRHGGCAGRVAQYLGAYLVQHPIGEMSVAEGGLRAGPGETVFCPDVGYTSNERAAEAPLDEYYPFAPDLAVEVWSPDNTEREMSEKAAHYLAHGGRLVWLLRPQDRTVRVHRADAPSQTLHSDDPLSGEDVLPGFSVPVSSLFP